MKVLANMPCPESGMPDGARNTYLLSSGSISSCLSDALTGDGRRNLNTASSRNLLSGRNLSWSTPSRQRAAETAAARPETSTRSRYSPRMTVFRS